LGARRASIAAIAGGLACCLAPAAGAGARQTRPFPPRLGPAMGLVPTLAAQARLSRADAATGSPIPLTYHGGAVMAGGVRVHTIFWAPAGYAFQGSPGGGVPTYEGLIQQFFGDVAHDSGAVGTCTGSECDAFTVLPQFAEGTTPGWITPGAYSIAYDPAVDSVDDSSPYPPRAGQCASPAGTATCLTDGQIQAEVDRVIQATPGAPRGLSNLWLVFLPPGVDECITAASCGTNSFAGYHGISNLAGHGVTIYAVVIDPIIELQVPGGSDPQGYPDAEAALDTAAHETVEAMTDPEGAGWMDPAGFEVGDKCDIGPQVGAPLGFAPDGSPYNQVINGHQYLIQDFWANLDSGGNPGCVQATTTTANGLPLPQVNLRQFNPVVTGNVERVPGGGITVTVTLRRESAGGTPQAVARASTTTAADGSWSVSLAPHAVGDDRDEIDVDYSGPGAPQPSHQVILTGNGGDPFSEAGWTGWLALDAGAAVHSGPGGSALTLAPCFQTGVLSIALDGVAAGPSPSDFCNTQTDSATIPAAAIRPGDVLTATSNDNRAFAPPGAPGANPAGGLVRLTVPLGEPAALAAFTSPLAPLFTPTGMPACTADLELDVVQCLGLVPRESYTLIDRGRRVGATADATGAVIAPLAIAEGDSIALSNGARVLTTLHVAHLRVVMLGDESVLAGGRCQPGEYFGLPPSATGSAPPGTPTSASNGGVALTGEICPLSGRAAGLPAAAIVQSDDLSGGLTETEVPDIVDTSPIEGETVYGRFTALAETAIAAPGNTLLSTDSITAVALRIAPAAGGRPVFRASDVDTLNGVSVPALYPGPYTATWTVIDGNGDVRVAQTRFIERLRGAASADARISCSPAGGARLRCRLRLTGPFAKVSGRVHVRLARGGRVVALGQGRVRRGRAVLTLRRLRQATAGGWRVTIVLAPPHQPPQTIVLRPRRLL